MRVKCVNQMFNEVQTGAVDTIILLCLHNALEKLKCCVVLPAERPQSVTDPADSLALRSLAAC